MLFGSIFNTTSSSSTQQQEQQEQQHESSAKLSYPLDPLALPPEDSISSSLDADKVLSATGNDGHSGDRDENFVLYDDLNLKVLNGHHQKSSGNIESFGFVGASSTMTMVPIRDTDCFSAGGGGTAALGINGGGGVDFSCLRGPTSSGDAATYEINQQIGRAYMKDRALYHSERPGKRRKKTQTTNNPSEATDKILSDELKRLTMHEREKVTEDIHGIAEVIDETPEFIDSQIQQFDAEITKLRKRHARITSSNFAVAYEKALFLNPRLLQQDQEFKLMFLRGDLFNAEKAASRMMLYFTTKLELFGLDKLCKQPITLDDLDHDDKGCLYSGSIQPLKLKDRAGRRVIAVFPKHAEMGVTPCFFRAMFYILMAALENDVDVQRRGCVYVFNFLGGHNSNIPPPTPQNLRMPKQFHTCLPRKICAMHAVYDDAAMGPLLIVLALIVPKLQAIRFRSHFGSHLEITYALRSFGVPAEHMPVDDIDGVELVNDWFHNVYLEERKMYESQLNDERSQSNWIIPTSNDCLLGRGRPFQEHIGNKQLASLIDEQRSRYAEAGATYGRKNLICDEIVNMVHKSGGRFLKQKSSDPLDGWELVGPDIARDKISHGFRTKKKTK